MDEYGAGLHGWPKPLHAKESGRDLGFKGDPGTNRGRRAGKTGFKTDFPTRPSIFLGRKIQFTPFSQRKPCRKSSSMVVSTPHRALVRRPCASAAQGRSWQLRSCWQQKRSAWRRQGPKGRGFDGFWRLDRYNILIWFNIINLYKLKVLPWNIWMMFQLHLP